MLSCKNGRSRVLSRLVPSTTRGSRWHQVDLSGKAKREVWRKLQSREGEVLRSFLGFVFACYWGADPTRSKLMQEVDQATRQCGSSCTVTMLLILASHSGGQGPDSDRTFLFWSTHRTFSSVVSCRVLYPAFTAVRAVRTSEVEVCLARLESSQRITWRRGFGNLVRNMYLLLTIGNTQWN